MHSNCPLFILYFGASGQNTPQLVILKYMPFLCPCTEFPGNSDYESNKPCKILFLSPKRQ